MGTFVSLLSAEHRNEEWMRHSNKRNLFHTKWREANRDRLSVRRGCRCRCVAPGLLLLFYHCELSRLIFFLFSFISHYYFFFFIQKYNWRGERVGRVETWTASLAEPHVKLNSSSFRLIYCIWFIFVSYLFLQFVWWMPLWFVYLIRVSCVSIEDAIDVCGICESR